MEILHVRSLSQGFRSTLRWFSRQTSAHEHSETEREEILCLSCNIYRPILLSRDPKSFFFPLRPPPSPLFLCFNICTLMNEQTDKSLCSCYHSCCYQLGDLTFLSLRNKTKMNLIEEKFLVFLSLYINYRFSFQKISTREAKLLPLLTFGFHLSLFKRTL